MSQEQEQEELTLPATGKPSAYLTNADAIDHTVLQCAAHGYSMAQMAACLGIGKRTFMTWVNQYPRFAEVYDRAITLSQAWWEGRAMDGRANGLIGASVWNKSMSARFPGEYTDRQEQGHFGDGAKVERIQWEVVDPPEREAPK